MSHKDSSAEHTDKEVSRPLDHVLPPAGVETHSIPADAFVFKFIITKDERAKQKKLEDVMQAEMSSLKK